MCFIPSLLPSSLGLHAGLHHINLPSSQFFDQQKKVLKIRKTSQIAADQLQEERRETPNIAISICFFEELASYVKNKTNTALFVTLSKYLSKFQHLRAKKRLKTRKMPKNKKNAEKR